MEYKKEKLSDKIVVCVTEEHKFGTDAFLLSDFADIRDKDIACDLGTGCGIIPLLWYKKAAPKRVYAVDIQHKAIEQLKESVKESDLGNRIVPICADLKSLSYKSFDQSLDVVTCNPPYKRENSGIISRTSAEQIARHEIMCTIDDVCGCASRILKFGGRLCICNRPERLCDCLDSMRRAGIEPKRIRFVHNRADKAPWLFLLEGRKGSKSFMKVLPPLIVEGENGFSDEVLRIYGKM